MEIPPLARRGAVIIAASLFLVYAIFILTDPVGV